MLLPIHPDPHHPAYWSLGATAIVLLGGSVEDNLFQVRNVDEHLDTLVDNGGNYVRCTMSSRDEGDEWPHWRDPQTGLYDLTRLEGPYWKKFETFVQLCREREIVLQIEVWDRFDYSRGPWQDNPFNPANNSTYDEGASTLKTEYPKHPGSRETPFFRTPPALEDNALLRGYQERFVDRLLEVTLGEPHILYCISNETNESPEWGKYWATYIRTKAEAAGVPVQITEMWDARQLDSEQHRNTWMHPEIYDFVDVSQVNHQVGQAHWDNLMAFRELLKETGQPRPVNTVKTYGANSGYYGTTRDGQERFWRSMLAGIAAVRYHRPTSGLGLNEIAQANIRSARMFCDKLDIKRCRPDSVRIIYRSKNEAYGTADPGQVYGLYFPDGGDVVIECPDAGAGKAVTIHWLDIRASKWIQTEEGVFDEASHLPVKTPREEGYWACVVMVD